jgi:hypothetical protein
MKWTSTTLQKFVTIAVDRNFLEMSNEIVIFLIINCVEFPVGQKGQRSDGTE